MHRWHNLFKPVRLSRTPIGSCQLLNVWGGAEPAIFRNIHKIARLKPVGCNLPSQIESFSQKAQPRLQTIRLPNTREGKKAECDAIALWESHFRLAKGNNGRRYIAQRNGPLVLEIGTQSKTIYTSHGIRFCPTDPLGEQLWNIANPTARARAYRWIRSAVVYMIVFYYGSLILIYCFIREKVPIVGLWRFNCLPHRYSEWVREKDRLTRDERLKVYEGSIAPHSHPLVQQARSILNRLVRASGTGHIEWDLQIIHASQIDNASVSPSGQVIVFSGILKAMQREDELAAVLSHEIAHILAHQLAQTDSATALTRAMLAPLTPFLKACDLGLHLAVPSISLSGPLLAAATKNLALRRDQEREADYIGLILMADAGFDPFAAAKTWERMNASQKRALLEFRQQHPEFSDALVGLALKKLQYMSTHPHPASRVSDNKRLAPEALQITGRGVPIPRICAERAGTIEASKKRWKDFVAKRESSPRASEYSKFDIPVLDSFIDRCYSKFQRWSQG